MHRPTFAQLAAAHTCKFQRQASSSRPSHITAIRHPSTQEGHTNMNPCPTTTVAVREPGRQWIAAQEAGDVTALEALSTDDHDMDRRAAPSPGER